MGLRPIDPRVLALARDFGIEEQNFQWPADFIDNASWHKKHANVHYMLWLLLIIVITIIIYYLLFVIYDYYYFFYYYY